MAEGAFRAAANKAGLDVVTDSCGTASYHIGNPPDPRAIATAARHGVDISSFAARQLTENDFRTFDYVFALDTANLAGIRAKAPRDGTAKIALLMDIVPGREGETVSDPYYGDDGGFEITWEDVTTAADALMQKLKS